MLLQIHSDDSIMLRIVNHYFMSSMLIRNQYCLVHSRHESMQQFGWLCSIHYNTQVFVNVKRDDEW